MITILEANKEDLKSILDLQHLAYQSEAQLVGDTNIQPLTQNLNEIQKEFNIMKFFKAVTEDGTIIGSVRVYSNDGTLHIGKLMVHPSLQGRGIGTQLLNHIETACPHTRYELFTSFKSTRNIQLYERLGYRRFTEKKMPDGLTFIYLEKII